MNRDISTFLKDHKTQPNFINDIFDIDQINTIPIKSGVYLLISEKQKFVYPNGLSKVIYIGKAVNLKSRLKTHHRHSNELKNLPKNKKNSDWFYSRYQYVAKFGSKVYWFTTRGKQDSKNLESKIIEQFYNKYLSLPVGNGAFSFKKQKK